MGRPKGSLNRPKGVQPMAVEREQITEDVVTRPVSRIRSLQEALESYCGGSAGFTSKARGTVAEMEITGTHKSVHVQSGESRKAPLWSSVGQCGLAVLAPEEEAMTSP